MEHTEIDRTLQECLRRHLPPSSDPEIDMSEELLLLGLDSMSAIGLLMDVEETFGIKFPDDMLDPEVFHSGATLAKAVRELTES